MMLVDAILAEYVKACGSPSVSFDKATQKDCINIDVAFQCVTFAINHWTKNLTIGIKLWSMVVVREIY